MRTRNAKQRLLGEESGFTLTEMMVTMMIMTIVLFALYSIFDMSLRVFSYSNNKVEAVEQARVGLERMEREIRAAYPCDASDNDDTNNHLFLSPTATSCSTGAVMPTTSHIIFANDLSDNDPLTTDGAYRKVDFPNEMIQYRLLKGSSPSIDPCDPGDGECKVYRYNGSSPSRLVEFVVAPRGLSSLFPKEDSGSSI